MSAPAPRYCQCGKRLARDSAGSLCGPCQRLAADQRAAPPSVSAGFWDSLTLRHALTAQHMGRVARAYRHHQEHMARYGRDGISQERLGMWLGLTQAQVSRIENGPPIRNLDTLAHWARVLRIPAHLLWFKLPADSAPGQEEDRSFAVRNTADDAGAQRVAPPARSRAHDPDAVAMRSFRSADLQAGGGHLYASVIRYLQADMAPRLFGSDIGDDNHALFTAAAALTEMAGFLSAEPVFA